jgi:aromatic-amino-acid transaminase
MPPGDVVLLHACCHNPTGADLTKGQWREVAKIIRERQILPVLDYAYQGFAEGLEEDSAGADEPEVVVARRKA